MYNDESLSKDTEINVVPSKDIIILFINLTTKKLYNVCGKSCSICCSAQESQNHCAQFMLNISSQIHYGKRELKSRHLDNKNRIGADSGLESFKIFRIESGSDLFILKNFRFGAD